MSPVPCSKGDKSGYAFAESSTSLQAFETTFGPLCNTCGSDSSSDCWLGQPSEFRLTRRLDYNNVVDAL